MSIFLGDKLLSGVATNTIENAHELFDFIWSDHIKNSMSWLRAGTFSWQSGAVYVAAYNHLVADYSGGTSQTETVGSYTITYVLADDGHKITTDETTVANIYAESGVAWYYILDTANTRFKLPRENPSKENLMNRAPVVVGSINNTPSGNNLLWSKANDATGTPLSNVNSYYFVLGSNATGTYYSTNTATPSSASSIAPLNLEAKLSNSTGIYKGHKYLYFYVGQYSQSATEQTAGLNAELFNGKADTDLTNVNNTNNVASNALNAAGIRTVVETYSNGYDWYRIYSDGWVEQGGLFTNANPFTINLLVAMSDTIYSALVTIGENGKNGNYSVNIGQKTTTNFSGWMSYSNTTYKSCWKVCGFKQ